MESGLSLIWILIPISAIGVYYLYYFLGGGWARTRAQIAASREPARLWARGVYGLISGDADYAYMPKEDLRLALSHWWGIESAEGFYARYDALKNEQPSTKPEKAWAWVRAVNLARMAAGAQLIDLEESWRLIAPLLPRIQSAFSDWEDLAQSYLAARDAWVRERNIEPSEVESVEKGIEALRKSVWPKAPFHQPLGVEAEAFEKSRAA